jgi:ABC-type polar amino acid transport system ATPase subunit
MVKATNINKSFGDFHVLKDINIELKPGEITVLFGPSGCGKTTLLRNLSLLDYPDTGELEIFDQHFHFPLKPNGQLILPYPELTVVFQQLFLWPHLTNKQNILLAIDKNSDQYKNKIDYFHNLVKELEMDSYISKYPNESSLGQKQRVAIARALILNPKFILFDEITASLDVLQIKNIVEILLALKKQRMGLMFITHNIVLAKKLGDELVYMEHGTIIETGSKEILLNPKTKELGTFLNLF